MDANSGKKRKLEVKEIRTKYAAIKDVENGMSKKDVAAKYSVRHITLSTWLKNKQNIFDNFEQQSSGGYGGAKKKFRIGVHEAVDKALYKWAMEKRYQGVTLHDFILTEKAFNFAMKTILQRAGFGFFAGKGTLISQIK